MSFYPIDPSAKIKRLAATLLPVAFVATLTAMTGPRSAEAFPPFKEKEGVRCTFCHFQGSGGPRNYRGLFYKAHNLSFEGFDDAAEAKKAGVEIGPFAELTPKSRTAPTPAPTPTPTPTPAPTPSPSPKPGPSAATVAAQKRVDAARAALAKSPKSAKARATAVSAYIALGDSLAKQAPTKAQARAAYLAAQKLDPKNASVTKKLASLGK